MKKYFQMPKIFLPFVAVLLIVIFIASRGYEKVKAAVVTVETGNGSTKISVTDSVAPSVIDLMSASPSASPTQAPATPEPTRSSAPVPSSSTSASSNKTNVTVNGKSITPD